MAKVTVDKVLANFVKTSSARTNSESVQAERPPVRRIKVKSSARPPVRMKLRVHYRASPDEESPPSLARPVRLKPDLADLLSGLDASDMEYLRKIEPVLLKWIRKSKKNAARFYANPVDALEDADIKVPGRLMQKIKRIRRSSMLKRTALPKADLTKVVFKK